jgi:molecular chaperone GrpE
MLSHPKLRAKQQANMIEEDKQNPEIEELVDEYLDLEESLNELADKGIATIADTQEPDKVSSEPGQAQVTEASEVSPKLAELTSEIAAIKQQLEERNSQYTRLYADFDNFRKRTERDKEEQEERNSAKILKKFLPVVDDFERAQSQIKPKTDAEAVIHNSYQSVYKQLVKCLKEAGVVRMISVGEEFDPNYHEAISQEPTNEFEEGAVMDELRPGYLLGERVLRHAMVRVAVAAESPVPTPAASESQVSDPNANTEAGS